MTSIHICAELPAIGTTKPAPQRKMLAIGLIRCKLTSASSRCETGEPEDIHVLGLMVIEDDVESRSFSETEGKDWKTNGRY